MQQRYPTHNARKEPQQRRRVALTCSSGPTPRPPGIIYVLNLLMGFTMGAVISSGQRKAVVLDGPSMAYFYIRRGMFVVDALASVPLFLLVRGKRVPFGCHLARIGVHAAFPGGLGVCL